MNRIRRMTFRHRISGCGTAWTAARRKSGSFMHPTLIWRRGISSNTLLHANKWIKLATFHLKTTTANFKYIQNGLSSIEVHLPFHVLFVCFLYLSTILRHSRTLEVWLMTATFHADYLTYTINTTSCLLESVKKRTIKAKLTWGGFSSLLVVSLNRNFFVLFRPMLPWSEWTCWLLLKNLYSSSFSQSPLSFHSARKMRE